MSKSKLSIEVARDEHYYPEYANFYKLGRSEKRKLKQVLGKGNLTIRGDEYSEGIEEYAWRCGRGKINLAEDIWSNCCGAERWITTAKGAGFGMIEKALNIPTTRGEPKNLRLISIPKLKPSWAKKLIKTKGFFYLGGETFLWCPYMERLPKTALKNDRISKGSYYNKSDWEDVVILSCGHDTKIYVWEQGKKAKYAFATVAKFEMDKGTGDVLEAAGMEKLAEVPNPNHSNDIFYLYGAKLDVKLVKK